MKIKIGKTISALLLVATTPIFATTYHVPSSSRSLIGQMQYSAIDTGDTVVTVAKHYDIGYNALQYANPQLSTGKIYSGEPVVISSQHLLPNQPREGIVINLPEMRMYYYPRGTGQVLTYPIGIGKIGKTIPIARTVITHKIKNPIWVPPEDIREFNLQQGIVLPRIMPAGPDNPLGPYAIYMRIPTYLIHSTIFPESIGKRASFGCIRMYESDIQEFFPSIRSGIPVAITNAPSKVGWENNRLFIETHHPLEEHSENYDASLPGMVHMLTNETSNQPTLVDWQQVAYIAKARDGIPHEVGVRLQ